MLRFCSARRALARAALPLSFVAWGLLGQPAWAAEVTVTAQDLNQAAPGLWIAGGLSLPAPDPALPLVGERVPRGAATLLRRAGAAGGINGFAGILYDNRDRDHSALPAASYPRLARLRYGPEIREAGADQGLAGSFLFPAVVFGNSSTAVTSGPYARSLPRLAMTTEGGPIGATRLYLNNHLYIYPEHRDFDAVDLYPANWPYTVISQGSSGSDQPFLQALAATLAAFPEDTFATLRQTRLMAPTLQMILRRSLSPIRSAEAYLSGAAHPVAFRGEDVSAGRMIALAAGMRPEDIPPLVRLAVEEETFRSEAGLAGLSERLFTTPAAIARVWRGFAATQEMVVSTAPTEDPFGRLLTYRWVLLRGDPERIEIRTLTPDGSQARLRIDWHDPYTEPGEIEGAPGERRLSRVDIAVFAEVVRDASAPIVSAPSFVSVSFPSHQTRSYGRNANGQRLIDIAYAAPEAAYDPAIAWSAPWTDTALYTAEGALRGWHRTWRDGREEEIALDGQGTYEIDRSDPSLPVLTYTAAPAAQ